MLGLFNRRLGIDIGSSNTTLVYNRGPQILTEPTYVAYEVTGKGRSRPIHFGQSAKAMDGKTPASIQVLRPLRQGAISNFESAADLVSHLLRAVRAGRVAWRRHFAVYASVPEAATNVEKRAIRQSLMAAGARRVTLVRKPIVAALGAGLDVHRPVGALIVDIGGGSCEISVISMTDMIASRVVRIGGDMVDAEIAAHIRKTYQLVIGDTVAEEIKCAIGSALVPAGDGPEEDPSMQVRGRSTQRGMPSEITLSRSEIARAIIPVVDAMADAVRGVLENVPPEIVGDLHENGMVLTGGMARLHGLAEALSHRLNIRVLVPEMPNQVVARGLASLMNDDRKFRHIVIAHD